MNTKTLAGGRNPARFVDTYPKAHNSKHPNNPEMHMLEFKDSGDERARNERAYRILDTTLRRKLHGKEIYQYLTYHQAARKDWMLMDDIVRELRENPSLAVFAQGEDEWVIKLLLELKMETTSRRYRSTRAAERRRQLDQGRENHRVETVSNMDLAAQTESISRPAELSAQQIRSIPNCDVLDDRAVAVVPDITSPGANDSRNGLRVDTARLADEGQRQRATEGSQCAGVIQRRAPGSVFSAENDVNERVVDEELDSPVVTNRMISLENHSPSIHFQSRSVRGVPGTNRRPVSNISTQRTERNEKEEQRSNRIAALEAELDALQSINDNVDPEVSPRSGIADQNGTARNRALPYVEHVGVNDRLGQHIQARSLAPTTERETSGLHASRRARNPFRRGVSPNYPVSRADRRQRELPGTDENDPSKRIRAKPR